MYVQENYRPQLMVTNSTYAVLGSHIGGFLCTVSGVLDVFDGPAGATAFVTALPVTAGVFTPIPLRFSTPQGGTVVLSGGAAGTLFI